METADRVRHILATKGLSLYRVSKRSAEIFGHSSPYFIPERFYFDLAAEDLSPSLYQLLALSSVTGYRLSDWLSVFGFCLDEIPRLQLGIPRRRTVLLDSSIYDEDQWIPWFAEGPPESAIPPVAPMGQLLKLGAPKRAKELLALNRSRFLYAKIGHEDRFAFPTLAPGSIARIDVRQKPDLSSAPLTKASDSIYLVESGPNLHCGHLRRTDKDRIVLCSTHFPFPQLELTPGRGARIIGIVDAEIRPFAIERASEIAAVTRPSTYFAHAIAADSRGGLEHLLRMSRIRVGLSFREASALSQSIAGTLEDPMYFAAAGTLSDYERHPSPPRHIQKIISLCILYCIDFRTFLRAGGLLLDTLGSDPIPDRMIGRADSLRKQASDENASTKLLGGEGGGFLSTLIHQCEELPLFITRALSTLTGLKNFSFSDIFWVGGNRAPVHPCLAGAIFVAVNRREKAPLESTARTAWEEPLYIVLRRDGNYLCGSCRREKGVLIVHPHSEIPHNMLHLRSGVDGEVIGRVTAIARRLF